MLTITINLKNEILGLKCIKKITEMCQVEWLSVVLGEQISYYKSVNPLQSFMLMYKLNAIPVEKSNRLNFETWENEFNICFEE